MVQEAHPDGLRGSVGNCYLFRENRTFCIKTKFLVRVNNGLFPRQVSVAEVERSHLVLHSMCMRAWAEDSLSVADTQSRILALTANVERISDQVSLSFKETAL